MTFIESSLQQKKKKSYNSQMSPHSSYV